MMNHLDRRHFLSSAAGLAAAAALSANMARAQAGESSIGFGLVTYMWGAEWDLPTLLKNCRETNVLGVELRTTHKHAVEANLDEKQRALVRNQFADSGVTLVGIGSNERYDHVDPAALQKAIDATKEFIRLSHDVGGSGVKVKPDTFHKEVPREKTIEQIGKALNELGEYAAGFGQQVRLEVHGQCAELPTIKAIMDIATDENVAVCWNSNPTDLAGDGLEANYHLVAKRFGQTVHVHELESKDYPYAKFFELLVKSNYEGWVLLEAGSKRDEYVSALAEQKKLFDRLLKGAGA
ncbi:MAG TPA: TIM barrel protein [Pirellulaceae bacterium]|nr:TIM barrel protein [Pirellulaceae bacterium]